VVVGVLKILLTEIVGTSEVVVVGAVVTVGVEVEVVVVALVR
jgi:hypothetical protein